MQSSKVGRQEIWYDNSEEFYELKKEIFGENCYYLELESFDDAQDRPRIIDAGAHIGMASIYFKTMFPQARIRAYEPVPSNYDLLSKNIEENQLEGVELNQAVVAPKSGMMNIYEPTGSEAWRSGAGIIPGGWKGVQKGKEIKVQAVGIAELLSEKIDIFKMDVEGMEYELIRNMGPMIRQVRNFLIEVHPRKGHRIEEIVKTLEQNGYTVEQHKDKSSLGRGLVRIVAVLK